MIQADTRDNRQELPDRKAGHPLLALHHRPQAHRAFSTRPRSPLFFFLGGFFALLMRLELLTPETDLVQAEDLQQALHHARHHHGLVLPDPLHSQHARAISSSP